ncbi:hypothetical protein WDZ92_36915 [Nostoc sp. NIES-2111]
MNDLVEKIARRLAPLVQEGIVAGHTSRMVSAGLTAVTVSPRPGSAQTTGAIRSQVEDALRDLAPAVVVEVAEASH